MATTTAERIAAIDEILAGPQSVQIGDRTITYNFAQLRKERNRLNRILASGTTSSFRRVVFKSG